MNKIIIFGFPHCGTSIFKSILGHCKEIKEIYHEVKEIPDKIVSKKHKYTLCKWPFVIPFKHEKYKDYAKIMIIRNPVYVFSSLNRRFNYKIPENHQIHKFLEAMNVFDRIVSGENDTYKIVYEDLFDNDYASIKNIFTKLGIKHDDTIFQQSLFSNKIILQGKNYLEYKKNKDNIDPKNHAEYRTFQINQEFTNFNKKTHVELTKNQIQQIKESEIIQKYFETDMI